MKPAVSVIVPCYNGGRFLDGLLASFAAQTFQNFETVIVDYGSTDPATLAKLASLPPTIRVLRQDNRGLPAARNAGFKAAQADFVLPLDCDDAIAPSFLAETVKILRDALPEIGFVFTHMRLEGARQGARERHFVLFDQLFLNQLPYCMLVRKAVWQKAGGYDETMRDGYEDWEFNIRMAEAGFRGVEIASPLFIYHVSADGMLVSRSARLHAPLWAGIRQRHPALYRPSALWAAWSEARLTPHKVTAAKAIGLITLAVVLPEAWFGVLFRRLLTAAHEEPSGATG